MTGPLCCLFALALAGTTACGHGGDRSESAARSDAEGTADEAGASSGAAATTIHLVISGGPHAGTYDARSADITCSYGLVGKGAWGNQYSVTGKKPNEFSSLQLIVPDTKDAADGTDKFMVLVGFGQLMQPGYSDHTINTQAERSDDKKGKGTLTVDDRGKSGKVTFKGKTADGVSLEGSIDCNEVMRMS
ncbi:MAG: hypothetical protein ACJ8BF_06670 [Gemmatimonadales bacterium]